MGGEGSATSTGSPGRASSGISSGSDPHPSGTPNAISAAATTSAASCVTFPHRTRDTPWKAALRPGSPPARCYRGAP